MFFSQLKEAIAADTIVWNADPMLPFWELSDPVLLEFGLSLKEKLNKMFNKTHGRSAMKLADIPGVSFCTRIFVIIEIQFNNFSCLNQDAQSFRFHATSRRSNFDN